ncbi:MAG: hypothetical protein H6832_01240 [Planctomycetes bacterium]|nr:hypothetical protein [Planctomycetota bacterium]MCB9917009.1 hypothetical protein [Planctomycetota bacterium]
MKIRRNLLLAIPLGALTTLAGWSSTMSTQAVRPVRATELHVVADDFVVDVWINGILLPTQARRLRNEHFGATCETIPVQLRAGDWVAFHVVHNPLRWNGVCYFGVYAKDARGQEAFTTRSGRDWYYCDDPAQAPDFVAHRGAGKQNVATKPERLWSEGAGKWPGMIGRAFPGDPIWGERPSTWIKHVVR